VMIYAYNQHVRLLPPEPLVVEQPKSTRVEGADIVMKSFEVMLHFAGKRVTRPGGTSPNPVYG
jgi:hypothetical protein